MIICEHGTELDEQAHAVDAAATAGLWRLCPRCRTERAVYHRVRIRLALVDENRRLAKTLEAREQQLEAVNTALNQEEEASRNKAASASAAAERIVALEALVAEKALETGQLQDDFVGVARFGDDLANWLRRLRRLFGSKRDEGPIENATFVAEQIAQLHETKLAKRNLVVEKQIAAMTRELEVMSMSRTRAIGRTSEAAKSLVEAAERTLRVLKPRARLSHDPFVLVADLHKAVLALTKRRGKALDVKRDRSAP